MSGSYKFSVRSWSDVYQVLRAKAESARGTTTIATDGGAPARFPRTTARDAFAIALVFDQAVTDHASAQLVARWICESDLVAAEPEDSVEIYPRNRSLWETLGNAAVELDRVRAPLPAPALLEEALRELVAEPDGSTHTPGIATSAVLTVFSEPTWKDMAIRQLDFFRALRGEVRDGGRFLPAVPCTCNADVLALANYWSDQLARHGSPATDTFHQLVHSAWREIAHRVRRADRAPAHETYAHNYEFWSALMLLATQTDGHDAIPSPWMFEVPTPCDEPRNAAPVDTGDAIDFPAAKTWDEGAQMQRDAFSKLRGEDVVAGRLITRVPRTTVADVRQLVAYWSAGLAKVGEHSFADISYRHVLDRWKAAVADVDRTPLTTDPTSVYVHNTDFWESLMTIAIQVALTAEAPTRWQLAKDATKHAIADLPATIATAARGVIDRALAKPLLYAGVGLGGLAIAALILRRPPPPAETRP